MVHQRKVQLVAGMTYTVSLPKSWAKKNSIANKSHVFMHEKEDGSLLLTPGIDATPEGTDKISINIDGQEDNVSHILYAAYYMGYETIRLFSKQELPSDARLKIKKTIRNLSGVEIVFEDLTRLEAKVLLDVTKLQINQLLFRSSILINSCIDIIKARDSYSLLERTEDDVDRITHLISKMILRGSKDNAVLLSSGIQNISHVLSYSAISKHMETISDRLCDLGNYVLHSGVKDPSMEEVLSFVKERLSRDISLLLKDKIPDEHTKDMTEMGKADKIVESIEDANIRIHLANMLSHMVDIEEELLNLMYYRRLME